MTQSLNSRMGGTLHGGFFEDCVERIQSFADFFGILGDSLGILLCISCNKYWWFWLLHSPPPLPPPPPPPPPRFIFQFQWNVVDSTGILAGTRGILFISASPVLSCWSEESLMVYFIEFAQDNLFSLFFLLSFFLSLFHFHLSRFPCGFYWRTFVCFTRFLGFFLICSGDLNDPLRSFRIAEHLLTLSETLLVRYDWRIIFKKIMIMMILEK